MNYLLKIAYDGKDFYGFEVQPNVPTIRGTLIDSVKKVFNNQMHVFASGRTDRYVHALSLPVLLRGEDTLQEKEVVYRMNEVLPLSIRVLSCEKVEKDFHVRFQAKGKTYRYLVDLIGDKDENYYGKHLYELDFDKLKSWSKKFIGEKNFASFTAKENYETFIRKITDIRTKVEDDVLEIEIDGEGFMRFMVRNIVGALLAHNRGQISDKELDDWISNPAKGKAHYKAAGSGLYLVEVFY